MPSRRPQLAKLTRPRLHSAIARERLFRVIDDARRCPVTWIVGPPGAGKTTVVSTYLDAAGAPTLWYQVDGGDDDPATFFYYLREAALPFRARRKPLPLLTPEYLGDVPGFARRFFRELFLGLPPGVVVALDNYQDADEAGALHALFAIAIEETPPDVTFIVMSRAAPPAALARARVGERIAEIGAMDLQLDFDETRAIAARRARVDEPTIQLIFEQSNGWTAGVMLLLERVRRDGVLYRDSRGATSEATFDYFASQIFHGSPPETRQLLMAVAWLPQVTAVAAERVSGNANAGQVLEFLYRRHLFVDRRPGEVIAYRFHSLFREFLRHQAETEMVPAELDRCLERAADVLAESGEISDVLPLLVRTGRWETAATLLASAASALIAQGRWRTFEELVSQLPGEVASSSAAIQYWLGQSRMAPMPEHAREAFSRAFDLFIADGNACWAAMCAASAIEAVVHSFIDFAQCDVWVDRLDRLLADGSTFEDPAWEIRVRSALVMVASYRMPDSAGTRDNIRRVIELVDAKPDPDVALLAASAVINCAIMFGDDVLGERAARQMQALLSHPSIAPHRAVQGLGSISYWYYVAGRYELAVEYADRALDLAREHGLSFQEFHRAACIGYCHARALQIGRAREMLARAEQIAPTRTKSPLAFVKGLAGLLALLEGDAVHAVRMGLECVAGAEASGSLMHHIVFRILLSDWAVAAGELELAGRTVDELRHWIARMHAHRYEPSLRMAEAHLAWERGAVDEAERLVAHALHLAKDRGGLLFLRWLDTAMPKLLPLAIERGIEPAIVRRLVSDYGVAPPPDPVEHWPWPIAVTTLGRFEVRIAGEPLRYGAKSPRRTLALLQVLIAHGARDVSESTLHEALWPDLEGDDAHRAFEAALHRLRRLLGDSDAIVQKAGSLTIDSSKCWIDANAFEWWDRRASDCPRAERCALSLYRGAFLPGESAGWALQARERLRDKFVRIVAKAAACRESSGAWEEAGALFQRGLDTDPLIEPFYQGLMRCHARQARTTEVARVYRRMRETFSVILGVTPSPVSDRIFRETVYPEERHG